MQIPLRTRSSVEAYIAGREWRDACLQTCPSHPDGGCSFARHGSYARATPKGIRIARWYCPEGHRTFSLLPDFLAARFPGLLADVERAVREAHTAQSLEAAADMLRGFEVTLPSALRWLRRRVRAVAAGFGALPQPLSSAAMMAPANGSAPQLISSHDGVLLELRRSLSPPLLHRLAAPLGFLTKQGIVHWRGATQHAMGPDEECEATYARVLDVRGPPCYRSPPIMGQ